MIRSISICGCALKKLELKGFETKIHNQTFIFYSDVEVCDDEGEVCWDSLNKGDDDVDVAKCECK